jgi:DNA-binding NtrC family response regulator
LSSGKVIGRRDLPFDQGGGGGGGGGGNASPSSSAAAEEPGEALTLVELERRHIERVLRDQRGRVEEAARILGIPRSSLYQKLKKYGIAVSRI